MKKIIVMILSVMFFSYLSLLAQNNELFIPRNLVNAYENGTRSYDGNPGPNYWQNNSEYEITAEINVSEQKLIGSEKVRYFNNSQDNLTEIVFRLYHDIYKKGNSRDWQMHSEAINDGMLIKRLFVNGKTISLDSDVSKVKRAGTNMFLKLDEVLVPGNSIDLEVDWEFDIPDKSKLRMGVYDSTSFFLAYWYPQIAVYDDIDGWDYYNYGGTQEYYNDFCDFNVKIKVPENFVVWATGELQNPEEVFSEKILKKYNTAQNIDTILNIITKEDLKESPITATGNLIYNFKSEYVPDFTFGVSDHYLWDLTSVVVDSLGGKRAVVGSAYKAESKDFYEVAKIARDAIEFFSTEMPAVSYPYPELTVFNGHGGMESPMMVNDGSFSSWSATVGVTSHEIAHTYFPFYMGINERKYAYMDEGWAVMLPYDFQEEYGKYKPVERNMKSFSKVAGTENEIPLFVPTTQLRSSYRKSAYVRAGAAYYILKETLGKEKFIECLHEFMNRWNGKHPIPYDFYFTFNEVYGDNLNWFWKPWFFEPGYPDLGIKKAVIQNGELSLTINKIGNMPIPVIVNIYDKDEKVIKTINETAFVWKDGKTDFQIKLKLNSIPQKIVLGSGKIPDSNLADNEFYF